jgi:pyrroline-5-carboxylate reductase
MRLGFAGAGKIASALSRGWADAERGPDQMLFCDAGSGRAAELAERTGGEAVGTLAELGERSDAVLLAVKPNSLEAAARQLEGKGDAIASVVAMSSLARVRELFPGVPAVRLMPTVNTEVQSGVICHTPLEPADGEAGARLLNLFGELGHLVEVPDELMDAATAVVGCSPAYLAIVIQNLAEAGVAQGFEEERAYELVLESCAGTIDLLRRYDPIEVRTQVASEGGATEAGLEVLADARAGDAFQAAVRASMERLRG